MAWMTSLFQGGRDPVDVERARVAVEAQRERALERGVEELELADIEQLDDWARRYSYRGLRLNRVEHVVDPLDPRALPAYLVLDANGNLHFFDRSPRQPKP